MLRVWCFVAIVAVGLASFGIGEIMKLSMVWFDMKRSLVSLVFIALAVSFAFGQSRYVTYNNARFGYSIEFPSELLEMQDESDNGDGTRFVSKDGSAEMRVWGQFNALNRSVRDEYAEALERADTNFTYKSLLKNGFAISGISGDKIYYQKTLYRPGKGGVFYTFTIEYPAAEQAKFDAAVKRIVKTFKFDPSADV